MTSCYVRKLRAKVIFHLIFAFTFIFPVLTAAQNQSSACSWTDVTRDVYINGTLDRSAQVMSCEKPRQYLLISPKLSRVGVLDLGRGTVNTASRDVLAFSADRSSAISRAGTNLEPAGTYARIDGTNYLFNLEGTQVLIRPHAGLTGEISAETLFETVPVWRHLMGTYQPVSEAVERLKQQATDTHLVIILGSWCPDSKNYVPKLLKAVDSAGNPKITTTFVGIDSRFTNPIKTIQDLSVTNVPTVVIQQGGREIGRIVETPATASFESDLAGILRGEKLVHTGRWERGSLIAAGRYSIRSSTGVEVGTDTWQMYATSEGGRLLHSEVAIEALKLDVWHRIDASGATTFSEVTRHGSNSATRSRYRFEGATMTARVRGGDPGVIEQTVGFSDRMAFMSPAIASQGWAQAVAGHSKTTAFVCPLAPGRIVGTLGELHYEAKGEETVAVPAGEFRAKHQRRSLDGVTSEWWFHPQLAVPVKASVEGGIEYLLVTLKLTQRSDTAPPT